MLSRARAHNARAEAHIEIYFLFAGFSGRGRL